MKKIHIILIATAILALLALLSGPFYIVEEGELAVVTRFGKIIQTEMNAGLKMKMPFVDSIMTYPKRIQSWDGEAQLFPTQENQLIWVDFTARWRIVDPKKFYETLGAITQAHSRLDDVVNSSARDIIAVNPLRESVRNSNLINTIERKDVYRIDSTETNSGEAASTEEKDIVSTINTITKITYEPIAKGREKLSGEMLTAARGVTDTYGIELIDVIIRQIKYSEDITENVYKQMIKERNQIARAFRSDGEGEKAKWLGKTEKELRAIRSEAERQAKEIKAAADGKALDIRNKAYGKDQEFAEFWIAVQQYEKNLPSMKKILSTDFEYFKYMYNKSGK